VLTQHQIDVNRPNAKLSTGLRSEAGKARASRNIRKHGLSSPAFFLLPGEDPAEFAILHDRLRAEYFPATTSQKILVEDMARCWWKILRADALRAEAVLPSIETLNKYERYATSARRAYYNALHSLLKVQKVQQLETDSFHREALKTLASLAEPTGDIAKPVSA
jgi:hypothetical protein